MPKGLSIREFARRDGCDEKVVRRKLISKHLVALDDGSIDPKHIGGDWRRRPQVIADVEELSAPASVAVRAREFETVAEVVERVIGDFARDELLPKPKAEELKENYAARLKRLEFDQKSSAVVEIEDQILAVAAEYALVKNRLMNIGARLAPRLAVMREPEEIKALIDREVVAILQELTLDAAGRDAAAA